MANALPYETSLRNALALAQKTNRLVLVFFFDPCCEACNRMKQSILTTECVQQFIKKYFIPIKYESGADSGQFMRFEVTAKPAILVLDADGNEVFRKIGCFEPELFIKKLEMSLKKAAHRVVRSHG